MSVRKITPVSGNPSVDQAMQQQAIAQALQQRALQPNMPANGGPVQAQYGPGNALVDLANSLAASWNLKQANNKVKQAQDSDSEVKARALADYQQSVPDDQSFTKAIEGEYAMPRSQATQGVGKAFGPQMQSQLAAALLQRDMAQPKPAEPYTLNQGAVRYGADNKKLADNPKADTPLKRNVEWKDVGDKLVPVYSDTGEDVPGLAPKSKGESPAQKRNQFEQGDSDLLAALAQRGVSLPQGLRSKEQMAATLRGLRERNIGATPDEIADKVASGQVSFGAEKKETQVAAGMGGKIRYAENEIQQIAPLVREASAKVPRGAFVPYNKLVQMADASISDPNLKEFKSYMTTLSNAYDMLAARGGTDIEKRRHNREMFDTADSPEALEAALHAVETEAAISGKAATAASAPRSERKEVLSNTNAKGWVLHVDAKGNKAYVSPDGKQYEVAQ